MMQNAVHLRSFSTVVAHGSFTRAAIELGLTQAAVSQHVRALEAKLGPLLLRRPRKLELTPAGAALLDYARVLEGAERQLQAKLAGVEAPGGDVGIITPGSVGLLLYPLLLEYQAENAGVVIRHRFAPDAEVLAAVLDNRFDLGILSTRPDDPRLAVARFAEEPLELVVPRGKPAADWHDLERLGFIDHPDGQAMATRLLMHSFSDFRGVRHLPITGFSNQIGLILEPVARGLGFTVLPRYARQAFGHPDAIDVVEKGPPVTDTLWLIHRSEWPLLRRVASLVEWLGERLTPDA